MTFVARCMTTLAGSPACKPWCPRWLAKPDDKSQVFLLPFSTTPPVAAFSFFNCETFSPLRPGCIQQDVRQFPRDAFTPTLPKRSQLKSLALLLFTFSAEDMNEGGLVGLQHYRPIRNRRKYRSVLSALAIPAPSNPTPTFIAARPIDYSPIIGPLPRGISSLANTRYLQREPQRAAPARAEISPSTCALLAAAKTAE